MKSKYLLHTYVVHSFINICGSVERIAPSLPAKQSFKQEESYFQAERNLITIELFFAIEQHPVYYRDNRKMPSYSKAVCETILLLICDQRSNMK